MSVSCGARDFISSLISSKEIERCEISWRARGLCTSQMTLSRKWLAGDGHLRFRRHGLGASRISVSLGGQRRRTIICARSSDSDSLAEDAENDSLGKTETAGDSVDASEAALRRDAVPSTSSEVAFDGCIAEFLPPSEQKRQGSDLPTLLRRFWKVAAPYWSSADKVKARFWLAGVFALTLATTGISVGFNFLGRDFYNALASKDQEQFLNQLIKYFAAFIGGIPVFVLRDYFRDTLALRWRGWMTTQYLDMYFENRTFYNIQSQSMIDNPDQRIVDDLNSFSGSALGFALALFNATINLISFSGILYGIYPPLFFVLLVYSIGGTAISVFLGKNLVGLNFMQEKKEADFRYGLVRVRENAESIAFYGGEASEIQLLLQRFKQSFDNYTLSAFGFTYLWPDYSFHSTVLITLLAKNFLLRPVFFEVGGEFFTCWAYKLGLVIFLYILCMWVAATTYCVKEPGLFTSFYRYLIQLLPAAVVAPLYFAGKIEFGVINQSFSAFNNVLSDFSIIVYQFQSLSAFSAVVDRLGEFTDILDEQNALSQATFQNGRTSTDQPEPAGLVVGSTSASVPKSRINLVDVQDSKSTTHPLLVLENLTLYTPQYSMSLFKDLSLVVDRGGNLLIMGASGSGKTSLLRAIAGLWRSGSGTIKRYVKHRVEGEEDNQVVAARRMENEEVGNLDQNRIEESGVQDMANGALLQDAESMGSGEVFFLPQRPYMVLGTLRQQLLYPRWSEEEVSVDTSTGSLPFISKQDNIKSKVVQGLPPNDDQLVEVLERVRLGHLMDRCDGLDSNVEWASVLSLGEQQRLAFARLLLSRPQLALMDESTSALDESNEVSLYTAVQEVGVTFISVGHRSSLRRFHKNILQFEEAKGSGGTTWTFSRLAEADSSPRR